MSKGSVDPLEHGTHNVVWGLSFLRRKGTFQTPALSDPGCGYSPASGSHRPWLYCRSCLGRKLWRTLT
jgi:hypothetical protein